MAQQDRLDSVRRQIQELARKRGKRYVGTPKQGTPNRWKPYAVADPRSGECFTDDSAWEFVAECLEAGAELQEIELQKPKGKTGWVVKHELPCGELLYMKVQLGPGTVIGRSFHYSDRGRLNR